MLDVRRHDAEAARPFRADVLRVWNAVFGAADEAEWTTSTWERHRGRDDFRLATAHDDGELIGFSWGYTGAPGQFWPDLVVDRLGDAVREWVGGHFEFVELAVLPHVRRQGAGGLLHDALLADLSHRRALLGTSADPDDPAVRLYLSRGWRSLGQHTDRDQVMGKLLPG